VLVLHPGCVPGSGAGRGTQNGDGVDSSTPVNTAAFSVNRPDQLPGALKIKLRQHGGYLLAPARINGQYAGHFMFDTGSSLGVVSTGVAGRLGLPSEGKSKATGIGGVQAFEFRPIRSLEFGGLGMADDRLAAISLHSMGAGIGTSVSGLIGIRALGGLPFTINYTDSTLTVYRHDRFKPPENTPVFPARFDFVGLPMVTAQIGNGHEVWLILDSGADSELTLPRKCLEDWPDIVEVTGTGAGASAGIGGTVASTRTWLGSLRLFGLDLKNTPVTFEQAPDVFTRQHKPIGRIGGALLKNFRLTIDPQRGKIWAKWMPGEIQE